MREDERATGGSKRVPKGRAKSRIFSIVISCWGLILSGAYVIGLILGYGSLTDALQQLTQPSLFFPHSMLLLSIPAFMLIGYLYQRQQNLTENLEQLVEERTSSLRESQAKLKNIFAASPNAITAIDLNGNITECNQATLDLLGYSSKEELIGKNGFALVAEKDRQRANENVKKVMEQGLVRNIEYTALTKDGLEFQAELSSSVIKDSLGNPTGLLAITRDITERKEMEKDLIEYSKRLLEMVDERTREFRESEAKLRDLFKTIPDSIAIIDLNANLLEFNETTLELFGYPREEINGKNVLDFIAEEDRERTAQSMKQTLEKGIVNTQLLVSTKDGKKIPVELNASVLKAPKGNLVGFVAVLRDITERKKMEKQLLKSERLAAIGELAAMVGHDLRNPLTGIATASYYLKRKLGSKIDKKTKEMLEFIEKDIEYSNKIISDLLDYSREIQLDLTETTPKSIMKESLSLVQLPKNIQISDSTQSEPKLEVDVEKMKRIFVNIIKNAIDAMPKGGKLTIKSKEKNGNLQIAITDTGAGIPKDILEKIWKPLFTTKAKGTGLGLSICKHIVEAHQGNITVESTLGKGTTFTITIPIKPELEGGEKLWVKPPESLLLTTTRA